jgi:hypothetical protein
MNVISDITCLIKKSGDLVEKGENFLDKMAGYADNLNPTKTDLVCLFVIDKAFDLKDYNHKWFKNMKTGLEDLGVCDKRRLKFLVAYEKCTSECLLKRLEKKLVHHFKNRVSDITRVKYTTLNSLMRRIQSQNVLFNYSILSKNVKTAVNSILSGTNSNLSSINLKSSNLIENNAIIQYYFPNSSQNDILVNLMKAMSLIMTFRATQTTNAVPFDNVLFGAFVLNQNILVM